MMTPPSLLVSVKVPLEVYRWDLTPPVVVTVPPLAVGEMVGAIGEGMYDVIRRNQSTASVFLENAVVVVVALVPSANPSRAGVQLMERPCSSVNVSGAPDAEYRKKSWVALLGEVNVLYSISKYPRAKYETASGTDTMSLMFVDDVTIEYRVPPLNARAKTMYWEPSEFATRIPA
jgi:hypothetical protein